MPDRKRMLRCSLGEEPADLVLKNAVVLNVFTEELIPADIAICGDTIVGVGSYEGRTELDCGGRFAVPGLIDAHVHLESSMASPGEFSKVLVRAGTTAVVNDPHEIVNVAGRAGLDYFLACADRMLTSTFFMIPSSVPAADTDVNGCGEFLAEDMKDYVNHPRVLGLAETMRFMDCITGEDRMTAKLDLFRDKHIDGHAPGLTGPYVQAYRLSGVENDHECTAYGEVIEKLRAGFTILMREGSGAKNLENLLTAVLEEGLPLDNCLFCTDDKHLAEIETDGHITTCVRKAIAMGVPVPKAYKMGSYNTARYYGMKRLGAIGPGYQADILLLSDLNDPRPETVIVRGWPLSEEDFSADLSVPLPEALRHTVMIPAYSPADIELPCDGTADIIGVIPDEILTQHRREQVPVENGVFVPDERFNKICVADRYGKTGRIGTGIIEGLCLHQGAIATTVAHDAHDLIAAGDNDEDILLAMETVRHMQGGYAIVSRGQVLGCLPLPIGGLMSDGPYPVIIETLDRLAEKARGLGVPALTDPFITLSFMALTVLPEIRITTEGVWFRS